MHVELIQEVVEEMVGQDETFTAYDVSRRVQAKEKERGLPFTRHLVMRDEVHRVLRPYLDSGQYMRSPHNPVPNKEAWLYQLAPATQDPVAQDVGIIQPDPMNFD